MDERFGNVLKDHPDVLKQSKEYPIISNQFVEVKELPDSFDGRDIWGTYMVSPANDQLSSSWAIVAKDVLNDRFCLHSGGQLLVNFVEYEIISCMDTPPNRKVEGVISYSDYNTIYQGYSIFDAWEYIYKFGVCQQNCFSQNQLKNMNIQTPDKITNYADKIKLYGTDCSNLEDVGRTSCLVKEGEKPFARRSFFSDSIYNVSGKNLEETVKKIKGEIVRWGPVAAGFIVYENFAEGLNKKGWQGTSIYKSVSGKPIGGHYVSIVGYGSDIKRNDKKEVTEQTDYWICRNNWGTDWGLLGYFKIKIGIPECKLEDNVSACSPYLYERRKGEDKIDGVLNGKEINIFDMDAINPKLWKYRNHLDINFKLFYTNETLEFIKKGTLKGSLVPLIEYPQLLPDMRYFWVKDILDYDYQELVDELGKDTDEHQGGSNGLYYLSLLIGCGIAGFWGYTYNMPLSDSKQLFKTDEKCPRLYFNILCIMIVIAILGYIMGYHVTRSEE